jgi:malate dehydrogenase
VDEVTDMNIWGNHSSTQYPDFNNAKISGKPAAEVINDEAWLKGEFLETVQKRGAAIIAARGASSAASAANAAISSIYSMTHDTAPGDSYSMCLCSTGEYGVDEGLIFSFPCRTQNGELKVLTDWQHDDFGQEKMQATLDELRSERDTVSEMGLL